MTVYARYKQSWSRLISEQDVILHLSTKPHGPILCGIEKRHPDMYNAGSVPDPIREIEKSWVHVCKLCRRSYEAMT